MKARFALVAASAAAAVALALPATTHAQNGEWEFWKSFGSPEDSSAIIRLAIDSQGTLYLSHSGGTDKIIYKSTDVIPALFADDPPTATVLYQNNDIANGFQGLVVDSSDNLFVVGDWDGSNPGEVLKFDVNGDPVTDFGDNGVLAVPDALRPVGAALTSDEGFLVIASVFGDAIFSVDPVTGDEIVTEADPDTGTFLRDIAVRPVDGGDDEIYGNVTSQLWRITGGSATDLSGYTDSVNLTPGLPLSNPQGFSVRPSVIHFPADDTVIFSNVNDDEAAVVVYDPVEDEIVQTLEQWGDTPQNLNQAAGVAAIHAVEDPDNGTQYDLLFVSQFGTAIVVYRKELPTSVEDWTILH